MSRRKNRKSKYGSNNAPRSAAMTGLSGMSSLGEDAGMAEPSHPEFEQIEQIEQLKSSADWSEIRNLPVGMLEVDPKYQRALNSSWVKEIADEFEPKLLDVIQVSYRYGHYWIFDGQHRKNAVEMKFNDPNYPVVCRVYHGLTEKDEARLFYLLNIKKKKMSSASMLKAQALYGDANVEKFLAVTKNAGFLIDSAKRVNRKYGIQAVKKAQRCFEVLGENQYERMLRLLYFTWDGEQWSIAQNMLGGMALFIQTYGDKFDDGKFVAQLQHITYGQIVKEAGRDSEESVAVAYASALVAFYNKGLRTGKLRKVLLFED